MEREGIMTADADLHGGGAMERNRFATAGWLSIVMAVLTLPSSAMHLMIDIKHIRWLLPFSAGTDLVILALGIYVLLKVRQWLNVNYDFHDVDGIIILLVVGNLIVAPLADFGRIMGIGESPFFLVPMYSVLVALSIVMILFAIRFLRVEGDMKGLKRPIAYTGIAIAVSFITFILIPLGVVLGAVFDVMIGLALLQQPGEEVDYV